MLIAAFVVHVLAVFVCVFYVVFTVGEHWWSAYEISDGRRHDLEERHIAHQRDGDAYGIPNEESVQKQPVALQQLKSSVHMCT